MDADIAIKALTFIVAVWGAALSTYMYLVRNRRAREIIKVNAWEIYDKSISSSYALKVRIINLGKEPVYLGKLPVLRVARTPIRRALIVGPNFVDDKYHYPLTLDSGKDFIHTTVSRWVADELYEAGIRKSVRLVPVCETSAGARFEGTAFRFKLRIKVGKT
jgi:hypothetical protein